MSNLVKRKATVLRGPRHTPNIAYTPHIKLHNVPKSAVPADLWRLCARAGIDKVQSVDLEYDHLRPTGNAWISLNTASLTDLMLKKFHDGIYIGASRIEARKDAHKDAVLPPRGRGGKGREQAASRGVLGSGPSGSMPGGEQTVCLSGFPEWQALDYVKQYLRSFKLASSGDGVVKMDMLTRETFNTCSRFLVRLASPSEAYRLVRKVHETDWEEASDKNRKWRLRAHIVY